MQQTRTVKTLLRWQIQGLLKTFSQIQFNFFSGLYQKEPESNTAKKCAKTIHSAVRNHSYIFDATGDNKVGLCEWKSLRAENYRNCLQGCFEQNKMPLGSNVKDGSTGLLRNTWKPKQSKWHRQLSRLILFPHKNFPQHGGTHNWMPHPITVVFFFHGRRSCLIFMANSHLGFCSNLRPEPRLHLRWWFAGTSGLWLSGSWFQWCFQQRIHTYLCPSWAGWRASDSHNQKRGWNRK